MNDNKFQYKNQNENQNNALPPNLYSLLFSDVKHDNLSQLLEDRENDEELLNNHSTHIDNFFIMDEKLKQERDNRLKEKDKIYKIKKHFFLKDSYEKVTREENITNKFERLMEKEYLKKCEIAEQKLNDGAKLKANDIYYILRRNYPIFSEDDKSDVNKIQRLYKAYNYGSIFGAFVCVSYIRAIMLYFRYEVLRSRSVSYLFLITYGVGIYYSFKHFVDVSYVNKLKRFCYKNINIILDYENEPLKTPYDENEKKYKPEDKNIVDVFKF